MLHTWQARDQPEKALQEILEKRYKDIEQSYKMLQKVYQIEDAHKIINEIWAMKNLCAEIELELMRRSWNNGTPNAN